MRSPPSAMPACATCSSGTATSGAPPSSRPARMTSASSHGRASAGSSKTPRAPHGSRGRPDRQRGRAALPGTRAAAPRRPGPTQPASRLARGTSGARTGSARRWRQCLRNCRQTKPTVQAVKSHLDALQDGVFSPEPLRRGADGRCHPGRQGRSPGAHLRGVLSLRTRASSPRTSRRPRRGSPRSSRRIGPGATSARSTPDLAEIRACYVAERQRLLQWQELAGGGGPWPREGAQTASARSRPIRRTACCGPSRERSPTPPPRRSLRR